MPPPFQRRHLLAPLTGTLATDAATDVALGDCELYRVFCLDSAAGGLEYLGDAGDLSAVSGYPLAAGEDSGWLDAQDRKVQLKREAGVAADYRIQRLGPLSS